MSNNSKPPDAETRILEPQELKAMADAARAAMAGQADEPVPPEEPPPAPRRDGQT